jgi:hypothetical protein
VFFALRDMGDHIITTKIERMSAYDPKQTFVVTSGMLV